MRGLYAIIDPDACGGRPALAVAEQVLAGGCAALQLRSKNTSASTLFLLAREMSALARGRGVPFFVNDRADVAAAIGAGVHVGQTDLPVRAARASCNVVGVSTHTLAQALAAEEQGAALIGFGPIFPTTGKVDPDPVVGVDALSEVVAAVRIPVVAIGGLSLERAALVARAGAALGASIGAICAASDPRAAARALHLALGGIVAP